MTRFSLTRDHYIPKASVKLAHKGSSAVVYLRTDTNGRPCAMGFQGTAAKPAFNHFYRNAASREADVKRFFEKVAATEAYKAKQQAERAAKLAAPHKLQLGHILVCSWGYEQTNVDYYQVTGLSGKRTVELRKIGCVSDETAWAQGTSTPRLDSFIGEPFTRRVDEDNGVKIASYAFARLWNGRPQNWTAYA